MEIPPIGGISSTASSLAGQSDPAQTSNLRDTLTAAQKLNNLNIADREFSVVRDPVSQRFVVVLRERSTGQVIDQFPPESILKMLSESSSADPASTGQSQE